MTQLKGYVRIASEHDIQDANKRVNDYEDQIKNVKATFEAKDVACNSSISEKEKLKHKLLENEEKMRKMDCTILPQVEQMESDQKSQLFRLINVKRNIELIPGMFRAESMIKHQ